MSFLQGLGQLAGVAGGVVGGYAQDKDDRLKRAMLAKQEERQASAAQLQALLGGANLKHLNLQNNALENPPETFGDAEDIVAPDGVGIQRVVRSNRGNVKPIGMAPPKVEKPQALQLGMPGYREAHQAEIDAQAAASRGNAEHAAGLKPAPTAQTQRLQATYKADKLKLKNLQDAITNYRGHLTRTGIEVLPGTENSRLSSAHANLVLQAKEAAKLGVLAGPDMGILEKLVNDPTSLGNALKNVGQFGGRAKSLEKQLDDYEGLIKNFDTRLEEVYGSQGGETGGGGSAKISPAERAALKASGFTDQQLDAKYGRP